MKNVIFISFLVFNFACIGKKINNLPIKVCNTNSDCANYDLQCVDYTCTNYLCEYTNKENNSSCGNSKLCLDGACYLAMGNCKSDSDCTQTVNPCLESICKSNLCVYKELDNGSSCGENKVCNNSFCINSCLFNKDCESSNSCINTSCDTSSLNKRFHIGTLINSNSNFIFILEQNKKNLYKYDLDFNFLNQNLIQADINTSNTSFFYPGETLIGVQKTNKIISFLDFDANFIKEFDITSFDNSIDAITSLYFYNNNWLILAKKNGNNLLLKFNEGLTSLIEEQSFISSSTTYHQMFYYNSSWYFKSSSLGEQVIDVYNSNLEFVKQVDLESENQDLYRFRSFFLKDNYWYAFYNTHIEKNAFLAKYNKDFALATYCTNTKVEDGTACDSGFCNNGYCVECFNDNICDDSNPCTNNKCLYGFCDTKSIEDGTQCSSTPLKFCLNSECIRGNCNNNDDCPSSSFCKENYCNTSSFTCSTNYLNQGAFCRANDLYGYSTFTCKNGICDFNPEKTALCDNLIINTGNIHGLVIYQSARLLNDGEEVLAIAGKYDTGWTFSNPNYSGIKACAGAKYFYNNTDNISVVLFQDDNTTTIKDGFNFSELINFYILTKNYKCRVLAQFKEGSISTDKWYPMGLSRIIKFKDYSTNSNNIDFSNSANCTPLN